MKECAKKQDSFVTKAIEDLREAQIIMVQECFSAAKKGGKQGRRYTSDWVYECILMRIKSLTLYEHLRRKDILPLPTQPMLLKYISSFSLVFGFKEALFKILKNKAASMSMQQKRGAILIDEMKLFEKVSFNTKNMQIIGFIDLGKNIPTENDELGDHGLVVPTFSRQMDSDTWVFFIKNASRAILHKLIIECVALLEDTRFYAYVIVTDGASWNRTMWKKFGVDEHTCSCKNPVDDTRQLWFASDFPHLIKCFRNRIVQQKIITTPDGVIRTAHWEFECT